MMTAFEMFFYQYKLLGIPEFQDMSQVPDVCFPWENRYLATVVMNGISLLCTFFSHKYDFHL